MKKFVIIDRQACVVKWKFTVEAETEAEAWDKYSNGEHGQAGGPEIGDSIEEYQFDPEIEEVKT